MRLDHFETSDSWYSDEQSFKAIKFLLKINPERYICKMKTATFPTDEHRGAETRLKIIDRFGRKEIGRTFVYFKKFKWQKESE